MDELVKYLAQGGGVGLLVLFIAGLAVGKVRWGPQVDAERKRQDAHCTERLADKDARIEAVLTDRDEWRSIAMQLMGQSVKAVDLAHKVTVG